MAGHPAVGHFDLEQGGVPGGVGGLAVVSSCMAVPTTARHVSVSSEGQVPRSS